MKNFAIVLMATAALVLSSQITQAIRTEQQHASQQQTVLTPQAQAALLLQQSTVISVRSPLTQQARRLARTPQPIVLPPSSVSPLHGHETVQEYLDHITQQKANGTPVASTPKPE